MRLWKAYLDHERANAQRVEAAVLLPRVSLAFDQALMCLRHFPEVCTRLLDCALLKPVSAVCMSSCFVLLPCIVISLHGADAIR